MVNGDQESNGGEANNNNDNVSHPPQDLRDIQPLSKEYIGLPISYGNIGVNMAVTTTLYPFLIVLNNASSAFYTSSQQLVTLFWNYKIVYGIFYDAYYPPPKHDQKFKPWICLGWTANATMLFVIAILGSNTMSPSAFVILLTVSNFFEIVADTAMDGFTSWLTQHELKKQRGSMYTINYQAQYSGALFLNILILLTLSGPQANCPGYKVTGPCTTDTTVTSRNSAYNNETSSPSETPWCHEQCDAASFSFGLSVPHFFYIPFGLVGVSLPFIFCYLKEEPKQKTTTCQTIVRDLYRTSKRQAVWQILLYTLVLGTLLGVQNAARTNANRVWLNLTTMQNTVIGILDTLLFIVALQFIRTKGLKFSWRKMLLIGKVFLLVMNFMYLLIVYDVTRNPWFYTVFSVSDEFSFLLADVVGQFPSPEIAEPGFESMTYALILTAMSISRLLSAVISQQLLSFFPALADQDSILADTPSVRHQMMSLQLVVEVINFSSLLVRSVE